MRYTHLPTGIAAESRTERSQHKNDANAMKLLKAKLYAIEEQKRKAEVEKQYDEKGEVAWGNQIRNYVLQPYTLVKDVRTGVRDVARCRTSSTATSTTSSRRSCATRRRRSTRRGSERRASQPAEARLALLAEEIMINIVTGKPMKLIAGEKILPPSATAAARFRPAPVGRPRNRLRSGGRTDRCGRASPRLRLLTSGTGPIPAKCSRCSMAVPEGPGELPRAKVGRHPGPCSANDEGGLDEGLRLTSRLAQVWRFLQDQIALGIAFPSLASGRACRSTPRPSPCGERLRQRLPHHLLFPPLRICFESFIFDLLRLWLVAVTRRACLRKTVEFGDLLKAGNLAVVTLLVVDRELNELKYGRVADWFEYLERRMKVGLSDGGRGGGGRGDQGDTRHPYPQPGRRQRRVRRKSRPAAPASRTANGWRCRRRTTATVWQLLRKVVADITAACA